MKRKPSPAVAISLVALFFSVTGAGLAAPSFWRIAPKVRVPTIRNVETPPIAVQPGATASVIADCPIGVAAVTGGGYSGMIPTLSSPVQHDLITARDNNGWMVTATNTTSQVQHLQAIVVCVMNPQTGKRIASKNR